MGVAERLEPILKKYQELDSLVQDLTVATSKGDAVNAAAKLLEVDLERGIRGPIPLAKTPQGAEDERKIGNLSKTKMIVDKFKDKVKRLLS